jgi:hypothetical protein
MVKVTLGENLVSSRHPFVKGSPYSDLIHNVLHARKLIRTAAFLFQLKRDSAIFSGYLSPFPKEDFVFHVFEKGTLVRSATLKGLGYSGELAIDVENLAEATGFDFLRSLAIGEDLTLTVW